MIKQIDDYFNTLNDLPFKTLVHDVNSQEIPIESAFYAMIRNIKAVTASGGKIMFIGNGGSASIASHCVSHYPNNGGMRLMALNDQAALTASANDFGYAHVYSRQIEVFADEGDILVAISSSGKSMNILNAVLEARKSKCTIYTLSGFEPRNPLRSHGDMNFYVPSRKYGHVELTHMAILHAIFDLMGEVK